MADILLDNLPRTWAGRPSTGISGLWSGSTGSISAFRRTKRACLSWPGKPCAGFTAWPSRRRKRWTLSRLWWSSTPQARKWTRPDRPGSSRTEELALDYVTDGPAIVAAFQQAYGIDVTRARLHWWRFKALMSNLPEETQLVKIIGFRTADLTQFQGEERERRAELKERFALPAALRKGCGRIVTLQDRNEAFAARFRR